MTGFNSPSVTLPKLSSFPVKQIYSSQLVTVSQFTFSNCTKSHKYLISIRKHGDALLNLFDSKIIWRSLKKLARDVLKKIVTLLFAHRNKYDIALQMLRFWWKSPTYILRESSERTLSDITLYHTIFITRATQRLVPYKWRKIRTNNLVIICTLEM